MNFQTIEDVNAFFSPVGFIPDRRSGQADLIAGVLPQYLTVVTAEQEMGKSTLVRSWIRALLDGGTWAGRETNFPPDKSIVVTCTDNGLVDEYRNAFPDELWLDGRLLAYQHQSTLALPQCAAVLHRKLRDANAGLYVIDGVLGLVGDVQDEQRTHEALNLMKDSPCPTLAIHHTVKGSSESRDGVRRGSGGRAKGSANYLANYRQTIRISEKSDNPEDNTLTVTLKVDGNYIADSSVKPFRVQIDRGSLNASPVAPIQRGQDPRPAKAPDKTQRALEAERVARLAEYVQTSAPHLIQLARMRMCRELSQPPHLEKVAMLWGRNPTAPALAQALSRQHAATWKAATTGGESHHLKAVS